MYAAMVFTTDWGFVVLEQKTTILWKCLYLLASLKDSPSLDDVYETNRRGGKENPFYE